MVRRLGSSGALSARPCTSATPNVRASPGRGTRRCARLPLPRSKARWLVDTRLVERRGSVRDELHIARNRVPILPMQLCNSDPSHDCGPATRLSRDHFLVRVHLTQIVRRLFTEPCGKRYVRRVCVTPGPRQDPYSSPHRLPA